MRHYLGHNLFKEALRNGSLDPFEEAYDDMADPRWEAVDRADIAKAIRFGLSGLIIHGWQNKVVTPIDGSDGLNNIDGVPVGYQFTNAAQSLQPADDDSWTPNKRRSYAIDMQGGFAISAIEQGLVNSMEGFLSNPVQQLAPGITYQQVEEVMTRSVHATAQLGLHTIPEAIDRGQYFYQEVFTVGSNGEVDTKNAMMDVTRNPTYFTVAPLTMIMRIGAYLNDAQVRLLGRPYGLDEPFPEQFERHTSTSLVAGIFRHAALASQIQNGVDRVVTAEKGVTARRAKLLVSEQAIDLHWDNKKAAPHRRTTNLAGPFSPTDSYAVLRTHRCPVGYTENPHDTKFISMLYDAILLRLHQLELLDPVRFCQPRSSAEFGTG